MTRKTVGYVELEWPCPNCGTRNAGARKTCSACGAAQPENVAFEQAESHKLIEDEKKVAAAKKGADLMCPYCGTRNPADAAACVQCGADLKDAARRESGRVVGAYQPGTAPLPPIRCPSCATENPGGSKTCSACGALLKPAAAAPVPAQPKAPAAAAGRRVSPIMLIVGACLLLSVCVLIGMLLTRTENVSGTVATVEWRREVSIEEYRDVQREAFIEDIPAEASLGACTQRVHHTQSEPAPNAREVCGTPYLVDQGNGMAEAVQDCQYEVSQDYCQYTIQEWVSVDSLVLQGSDLDPAWPQPNLSAGQRAGAQSELYTVVFETDSGTYTFTTSDPILFSQMQIGSEWVLMINSLGKVVDVQQ